MISQFLLWLRQYRWVKSQPNIFNLPILKVVKANLLGFTASEYVIYDLDHNNYKKYLTEFERQEFRRKVAAQYKILLDNKVAFYTLIKSFVGTNDIYCYKKNGRFVIFKDDSVDSYSMLIKLLREKKHLVFKRLADGGGHGFALLEYKEGIFQINNKTSSKEDVEKFLTFNDNYLIEAYCQQSVFENSLFPYSVNTVRIVTVENDKKGYDVAYALQRMGADVNSFVDNASGGGIFQKLILEQVA